MVEYTLYMDESGDHGLQTLNPEFPVFLLCGVLVEGAHYELLRTDINTLKAEIWGNRAVVFHSRDIRKCEKEFVKLLDMNVKQRFYEGLNRIMVERDYTIMASGIRKDKYISRYGRLSGDVYELSLSFIIERVVFFLDAQPYGPKQLNIMMEKRGRLEDRKLDAHFQRLLARGTQYVSGERLRNYGMNIRFVGKQENINGLQLADLIAYPIARYVIDPSRANPAFDQLSGKIYTKGGKRYGLKVFP